MSSPASLKALYSATLKASNTFTSYNFRNYFLRRTREKFEAMQVGVPSQFVVRRTFVI
jgi:hypothetical protein